MELPPIVCFCCFLFVLMFTVILLSSHVDGYFCVAIILFAQMLVQVILVLGFYYLSPEGTFIFFGQVPRKIEIVSHLYPNNSF